MRIYAGDTNLSKRDERFQIRYVKRVVQHPAWSSRRQDSNNDIGLIELTKDFDIDNLAVAPIGLSLSVPPASTQAKAGFHVLRVGRRGGGRELPFSRVFFFPLLSALHLYVSFPLIPPFLPVGWGALYERDRTPRYSLRAVDLMIADDATCSSELFQDFSVSFMPFGGGLGMFSFGNLGSFFEGLGRRRPRSTPWSSFVPPDNEEQISRKRRRENSAAGASKLCSKLERYIGA